MEKVVVFCPHVASNIWWKRLLFSQLIAAMKREASIQPHLPEWPSFCQVLDVAFSGLEAFAAGGAAVAPLLRIAMGIQGALSGSLHGLTSFCWVVSWFTGSRQIYRLLLGFVGFGFVGPYRAPAGAVPERASGLPEWGRLRMGLGRSRLGYTHSIPRESWNRADWNSKPKVKRDRTELERESFNGAEQTTAFNPKMR